eukprot:9888125-Alexandrium_andersonii.AAC.1
MSCRSCARNAAMSNCSQKRLDFEAEQMVLAPVERQGQACAREAVAYFCMVDCAPSAGSALEDRLPQRWRRPPRTAQMRLGVC